MLDINLIIYQVFDTDGYIGHRIRVRNKHVTAICLRYIIVPYERRHTWRLCKWRQIPRDAVFTRSIYILQQHVS